MPFKSKKQHRYFRYLESKGDLPGGTSDKWMKETENYKKLPTKVKEAAFCNVMRKVSASTIISPTSTIKPIQVQKQKLDSLGSEKRKGLSPVEYRYSRKNRL